MYIEVLVRTGLKRGSLRLAPIIIINMRGYTKIAITTANFGGFKFFLYPIAALKLGFMMIYAISPYSFPVKS